MTDLDAQSGQDNAQNRNLTPEKQGFREPIDARNEPTSDDIAFTSLCTVFNGSITNEIY